MESAALTALYVFFVTVLVHRDLNLARDVPRVVTECGLIIGGILLIMAVALGLTDYLVDAEVPGRLVAWAKETIGNQFVLLLALNLVLGFGVAIITYVPWLSTFLPALRA